MLIVYYYYSGVYEYVFIFSGHQEICNSTYYIMDNLALVLVIV